MTQSQELPESLNKGGRPTKYKPEHCQMLIDHFDIEPFYNREIPHYGKDGEVSWVDIRREANRLPTLRSFAKKIGVDISTVYNWLDPKKGEFVPEFLDAFTQSKDLLKWFLIENGLIGTHNPVYAKFVAVNMTDMEDKSKNTLAGDSFRIDVSVKE